MPVEPVTYFASPERSSVAEIAASAERVRAAPLISTIFEVVDGDVLILNAHWQALIANDSFFEHFKIGDHATIQGKRLGEILGCVEVATAPNGCATSRACSTCGAALAIMACQRSQEVSVRECLMRRGRDGLESAEFRVRCTPMELDGQQLMVLVLQDVSANKRRDVLERLFLHDLMNTIGGLAGWTSLFEDEEADAREVAHHIVSLSERLASEVRGHRDLLRAESGDLQVDAVALRPLALLRRVVEGFASDPGFGHIRIELSEVGEDEAFTSDPVLITRVLSNMLKNAIEATERGGVVRIWHAWINGGPTFMVNNPGVLSQSVRYRIFKRSFSTKGVGRGLGTYSMKLFGERYLGGRVGFSSEARDGTTFWLALGGAPGA